MALILVESGNVYQFTTLGTSTTSVAQIAGTQEIYDKRFLTGLTIHGGNSATLTTETGSAAILNGNTQIGGILEYNYTLVDATAVATSSLTTNAQWTATGSFLVIRNAADHFVVPNNSSLGSGLNGRILRVIKQDNNSNLVIINPSGTATVNGATQISSSDAYAAIELMYNSGTWRILSSYGTWN